MNRTANVLATQQKLLCDPDTFATVLLLIAVDAWGLDCLQDADDPDRGPWHPKTFESMLEDTFGCRVPQQNFDKLMAAVTLVTTDLFYTKLDAFISLSNVLSGSEFNPGAFDPADSVESAWAITEALIMDPPEDGQFEPFCEDIRYYLGELLTYEGLTTAPDVLRIAMGRDFSNTAVSGYSDDPELFQAAFQSQKDRADEVTSIVRDNLSELHQQLKVLPLREGTSRETIERLEKTLKLVQ